MVCIEGGIYDYIIIMALPLVSMAGGRENIKRKIAAVRVHVNVVADKMDFLWADRVAFN
jgi:hypothetical protein